MKVKVNYTHKVLEDILKEGDIVTLDVVRDDKGFYDGYEITIEDGRVYGDRMLANMIGPNSADTLFTKVGE